MDLGAASTRASHLALVVALVLGLLGAGCLSWEPEPNDDDVSSDDDDTPDDDDSTLEPPEQPLAADGLGMLVAFGGAGQQEVTGFVSTAIALDELGLPAIEEVAIEEIFGASFPIFAPPGNPRLLTQGDNYQFGFESLGDSVQLLLASGETVDLIEVGPQGFGLENSSGLGVDVDTGAAWSLSLPDPSPYQGEHLAERIPSFGDLLVDRQVAERIYLPEGETLEVVSTNVSADVTDVLLLQGQDSAGTALAYYVDPETGSVEVEPGDIPASVRGQGEGNLVWHRAARTRSAVGEEKWLLLSSVSWLEYQIYFLAPGVHYVHSDPSTVSPEGPLTLNLFGENTSWTSLDPPTVLLNGGQQGQATVQSSTRLELELPNGVPYTGLVDLTVIDSNSTASGAIEFVLEPLECDLDETEPNDTPAASEALLLGEVACGALDPAGDLDTYSFVAAPGATYTFEIFASRLGAPTDTTLTLLAPSGDQLAFDDDGTGSYDSLLSWTSGGAGNVYIQVASYDSSAGGAAHSYQMQTSVSVP